MDKRKESVLARLKVERDRLAGHFRGDKPLDVKELEMVHRRIELLERKLEMGHGDGDRRVSFVTCGVGGCPCLEVPC